MATNGTGAVSRDDILGGRAFRTREVKLGERTLLLRELTARELIELQKEEADAKDGDLDDTLSRAARLLFKVAIDAEGKQLFAADDAPKLVDSVSGSVLLDVYRTALGLSGLTEEAIKALGERSAETARSASSTA